MATKELCFFCFEHLQNTLSKKKSDVVARKVNDPNNTAEYPMFVTFEKDDDLRGCIGSFKPLPLYKGLQEITIDSAFNDPRFPKMKLDELPHLSVGISLLYEFEKVDNPLNWAVGKHGIILYLDGRSSTYLPEVAEEENWTQRETLAHLARKGGFRRTFDDAALKRSKVERYQSSKAKATWQEYQDYLASAK